MNQPVDAPGNQPQRTFLGHPVGLYVLFVTEMWERFSYYGMRALLVLYLINPMTGDNPGRGWTEGQAYLLYGWYTGVAYLLPLIGGFLADRLLGTHRSIILGSILIALGHVVLAISGLGELAVNQLGMSLFIGGLALIIIGTGYFKPCASVMVSQFYPTGDPRRDGGYTIFYMGVNVGAFLGPLACGALAERVGWHWGFGSAAVGMIAGLIVYLALRPVFLEGVGDPPSNRGAWPPMLFVVSLLLAVGVVGFYHRGGLDQLAAGIQQLKAWEFNLGEAAVSAWSVVFGTLTAAVLAWVVWFVSIQAPGEKGPTASIFIFMVFNAFFWVAFEQAGSTLNVFAQDDTNRTILGWEMPATWFQSFNPLLILLLGPIMAALWSSLGRRGRNPSQPVKIGLALLILGVGYVFMVLAGQLAARGAKVGMQWLAATYTFHTVGELIISPTALSYVTKAAPARYVAFLMGTWYISHFLANLGSGIIASYVKEIERGDIDLFGPLGIRLGGRADFFLLFVVSSLGAGLLILALTPLLKRLVPRGA